MFIWIYLHNFLTKRYPLYFINITGNNIAKIFFQCFQYHLRTYHLNYAEREEFIRIASEEKRHGEDLTNLAGGMRLSYMSYAVFVFDSFENLNANPENQEEISRFVKHLAGLNKFKIVVLSRKSENWNRENARKIELEPMRSSYAHRRNTNLVGELKGGIADAAQQIAEAEDRTKEIDGYSKRSATRSLRFDTRTSDRPSARPGWRRQSAGPLQR